MNWLYIAIGAFVGLLLPFQAGANARFAGAAGSSWWGATVSFVVGLLALLALTAATRTPLPNTTKLAGLPWWAWCGGIFGGLFVAAATFLVPKVGTAVFLAATIGGQMVASMIVDHYGLLGLEPKPISALRLGGILLLAGGVAMVKIG